MLIVAAICAVIYMVYEIHITAILERRDVANT